MLPGVLSLMTLRASAACTTSHSNVEGNNTGNTAVFGNRGDISINSGINYSGLSNSIHRSLFVRGSGTSSSGGFLNDVEVGWTANNGGHTNPQLYFEWVDRGTDTNVRFNRDLTSAIGTNPNFRVQDSNGDMIWSAFYGSESNNFDNTPVLNFSVGRAITNSERRNTCDSQFAHFNNLRACLIRNPCTWPTYSVLSCYAVTGTTNYNFAKISDAEHLVTTGSGIRC